MKNSDLPEALLSQMEGGRPPDDFVSNGCTCCPDEYGGIDLRPACHVHDAKYAEGGNEYQRKVADQQFYRNLRTCGASRFMAGLYFRRVRIFGIAHWNYTDDSRPRGFWAMVRLLVGRYVTF